MQNNSADYGIDAKESNDWCEHESADTFNHSDSGIPSHPPLSPPPPPLQFSMHCPSTCTEDCCDDLDQNSYCSQQSNHNIESRNQIPVNNYLRHQFEYEEYDSSYREPAEATFQTTNTTRTLDDYYSDV